MKTKSLFSPTNLALLSVAFVSLVLMSPKWTLAIMAWIHYAVLVRFYRDNNWKGFLLSIPILTIAAIISQYEVVPMDPVSLAVFMLIANTIGLLPFVVDRLTFKKLPGWAATLVFPAFSTLFSYLMDMGPQGTWSNSVYTQFHFSPLMQMAAVTGIYGICFMMFWFASSVNYWVECRREDKPMGKGVYAMPAIMGLVLLMGTGRLMQSTDSKATVGVATITMDNISVFEEMYNTAFDTTIVLPKNLAQSDPLLAEVNKGMFAFMKNPEDPKFASVYEKMDDLFQKYLDATSQAIAENAKMITWSEAAILNIKNREEKYAEIISKFAADNEVYLFFPTAVFHPEKVGKEELFIENKVLTYNPKGELVNTYFKNIPVMGVEPSFPGDGTIPVIETAYGNFSPIICYDADHPQLIAQVSDQATDVLVVPTGDWKAISPYHTYMAAVRCIENGVSMLKATSNGLSAVIDDRGRILASYDYFDEKEVKMMVHQMPIKSSDTLYVKIAPLFIGFTAILTLILLIWSAVNTFLSRRKEKSRERNLSPA